MNTIEQALRNAIKTIELLKQDINYGIAKQTINELLSALSEIGKCEPVAWCRRDTILNWGGQIINAAMMFPSPKGLKEAIPLYTSPQQREWKDIDLSEYENQGLGGIAEEICEKLKQLNSEKG